jgi:alkylation response protein AidB-like acyl-CoA dehydrogenase
MATTSATLQYPLPGTPELERLLERIAVGASERELEREPPFEQIGWIKEARLGAIRVPAAEGGGGASLRQFFEVLIALAEVDSNVAHILRVHFAFVERLRAEFDGAHHERWVELVNEGKIFGNAISEQNGHQVGAQFDTTLTPDPDGDGFRLNGEKFYSTGSLYSDWTQIYASTPDERIARASRSSTTGTASASGSPAPGRRGSSTCRSPPRRWSTSAPPRTSPPPPASTARSSSSTCRR